MSTQTELIDLQNEIADRLRADAYFADINVVTDQEPDLTALINRSLGLLTPETGKLGACVVVELPYANDANANSPLGPLDELITCLVIEHLALNRDTTNNGSGKHARQIARRIHKVCKLFQPQGVATPLVPQKPFLVDVSGQFANPVIQAIEARFGCRESVYSTEQKLSPPTITQGASTITITSSDAGVSIYYSVDGTHPWAGSVNHPSTATLYSVPVANPIAGTRVRACAFKTGTVASDVTQFIVI